MRDIDTIPTDELAEELKKRADAVVIVMGFRVDKHDSRKRPALTLRSSGDMSWCIGIAQRALDLMRKDCLQMPDIQEPEF